MTHQEIVDRLEDYLDGDLPNEENATIQQPPEGSQESLPD